MYQAYLVPQVLTHLVNILAQHLPQILDVLAQIGRTPMDVVGFGGTRRLRTNFCHAVPPSLSQYSRKPYRNQTDLGLLAAKKF